MLAVILAIQLVLSVATSLVIGDVANAEAKAYTISEITAVAQGIVDWKKSDVGSGAGGKQGKLRCRKCYAVAEKRQGNGRGNQRNNHRNGCGW